MNRGNIKLNNPERFNFDYEIPKEKLQKAIDKALEKLKSKIDYYGDMFPGTGTKGYKYTLSENNNWITGLHTGCFLLAYKLSGDKAFLDVAQKHVLSFKHRLDNKIELSDHDVGFLYSPSCVLMHLLTGDKLSEDVALDAAEHLYNHSYSQKGGFILRWADGSHKMEFCRTMMDTLFNIPLFYWSYEKTGDKKFLDAANSQIDITANYLIRKDGSSYHHYQFDVETHKPLYGVTLQGNRDESTWSRGHSWGVAGLPIAYSYTKDESLLNLHRDITYYMLNHLPTDNIPYWDYDFTDGDEPRDTSAGLIGACGMLMASQTMPYSDEEKRIFKTASAKIIEAVIDKYTGDIGTDYDGLIHGVTPFRKSHGFTTGECAAYGDYFYLEALLRYTKPDEQKYW